MPRKTAEERHVVDGDVSTELMDMLIALHHPTRRWLAELLWVEGPATVGRLAARTGLAVGSVSHHLKPLHQQGFIAPAPELARDTRESWWKVTPRNYSWAVDDFEPDSPGRRVAAQAEIENFRHQVRATKQWLDKLEEAPLEWRRAAGSSDSLVRATADQTADLHRRLDEVVAEWTSECQADAEERPDVERRVVRTFLRLFPQWGGAAVSTTESSSGLTLIGTPPPPVRRDRMVLTWVAAVAISAFGDSVWMVALAWTAAHTLPPALAGAVIGAEMLPQAALVLFGGVIADRWDPRKVLVAGQVARAAVLVLGAAAWRAGYDGAPTLFAIALTFGVAAGLTTPSGMALIRQIVNPDDFGTVMGWNQVLGRVMRLLGAPTGGILVAAGGPVAAMLVDAATFAVIALVLSVVVQPRYRLPRAEHPRWRDSFTDGLGYLRRSPTARIFVTGLTALNVFVSPVVALGLALRVDGSAWGPHWLGIADGALAAGAIVGSLAGIRWQPTYAAGNGFRALVIQGIGLAAVGVPFIPVVLAGMFVVGITAGLASVWLSSAFLKAIDAAYTGRVSSVTSLGDMTLMPLSMPLIGALAGATSVLASTLVFGLSMSVLCLWFGTRRAIATLT